MQIVVMAGGIGTRMLPFTEKVPKSMLLVNEIPFVNYQLALFKKYGITKVVFCLGHFGEKLKTHVGSGERWGLDISYSWEHDNLLGTGGALKNAYKLLDDTFLFTWGDSYVQTDYATFLKQHTRSSFPVSIGVFKNENRWDKSNVNYKNSKIVMYGKDLESDEIQYIDVGLSAFYLDYLDLIPDGVVSLDTLWKALSIEGKLGGIELYERFYEIGSKDGYEEFKKLSVSIKL